MAGQVKPIPQGYEGATPYLCVRSATDAIDFYKKAFGATEVMRFADPNGKIGHAELKIGNALIMLADEFPDMDVRSAQSIGDTPVSIMIYVTNVDEVVQRAIAAGATVLRPVADQFYGDRGGKVKDPFGHVWWFATHKEDVAPDELRRRAAALFGQQTAT